jgi:hypothetical protein
MLHLKLFFSKRKKQCMLSLSLLDPEYDKVRASPREFHRLPLYQINEV